MWKLATLKSNWEALDGRESTVTVHLCSAANRYKSQGTKKKKKKKEQQLSGGKNGSDLGVHNSGPFLFICGIARLLLPTAWLAASGCYCIEFFSFSVCVCVCTTTLKREFRQSACLCFWWNKQRRPRVILNCTNGAKVVHPNTNH